MLQYLVTAYDFTDADALTRRLSVRPAHLEGARKLKASGNFVIGGAMLNHEGKMIGSTIILQFETPEELDIWKQGEPYITLGVWDKVEIKPFRVADI